jgi:D-alanine-D-alanine ligase
MTQPDNSGQSSPSTSQLPIIWLLCGGPSTEYDVSLASARGIFAAFNFNKYRLRLVCIAPDGSWLFSESLFAHPLTNLRLEQVFAILQHPDSYPAPQSLWEAVQQLQDDAPLAAINAMHGKVGEDGVVQGLFALANVPMTGSHVEASALAMDKIRAREIYRAAGLNVPQALIYREKHNKIRPDEPTVARRIGFPCFVKPSKGGSSLGTSLVRYSKDLEAAVDLALEDDNEILIEERVKGREFTCGVLTMKGQLKPLAVTEIKNKTEAGFFDYESKYKPGAAEEITPAEISVDDMMTIQSAALIAHKALGCSGYSRSDFIMDDEGNLSILEVNTLPGMTRTSLLPQGAAALGIGMSSLVQHMIDSAVAEQAELPFNQANMATDLANQRRAASPVRDSQ